MSNDARTPPPHYDAYIFDLDGTIYLGDDLLPTVAETIGWLRRHGRRLLFLSNNPTQTPQDYAAKLTRLGVPTEPAAVLTSAVVLVDYLQRQEYGRRLFVVGEPPLCRLLQQAGFALSQQAGEIDVVIASFDRTFTYHKLQVAFDALRHGARFVATNADRYCPVPGGGQPDAAAMIAAIEAASGQQVEVVVGKPSLHMAGAALRLLAIPAERCLMTGDRLETDVQMGLNAGMATALVLTGAADAATLSGAAVQPDYVLHQLSDLIPC